MPNVCLGSSLVAAFVLQGYDVRAAGDNGPPVLLVHGFGASAYHWRYNIPALASSHRVYAVDLLGFGWSDKPLIPGYADYSVWQDQLAAFIREV